MKTEYWSPEWFDGPSPLIFESKRIAEAFLSKIYAFSKTRINGISIGELYKFYGYIAMDYSGNRKSSYIYGWKSEAIKNIVPRRVKVNGRYHYIIEFPEPLKFHYDGGHV